MSVDVDAIIAELNASYPCRESQFSTLFSVIGSPSFPCPATICLTGFPATGKSSVTRAFLDATEMEYAWVDCAETFTSALLFDRIVNKLREIGERSLSRLKMMGDINNFVVQVHKALEGLHGKVFLVCHILLPIDYIGS
jgi:hypothetical protein